MRILVICCYYPYPLNRGSNLRVFPILKYLGRRHTLDLVTFAREPRERAPGLDVLLSHCRVVNVVDQELRSPGSARSLRSLVSPRPKSLMQNHSAEMERAVDARVSRERYDAILCEWLFVAQYAERLSHIARILDDHNAEAAAYRSAIRLSKASPHRRARSWLAWAKLYGFERAIVRTFDGISAVSDLDRDLLRSKANEPAKIVTVPNGVDLESVPRFEGQTIPGQLIYPGSLTYEPNLDACEHFVARVLPLIAKVRPDVKLMITGALPASVPRSLRESAFVELRGLVPDVKPIIGESDVCVVPLRRGGGTRLKILEAFALGTAVVSTSKGAEGLAVTSGRELLIADTPHAFADAALSLLADGEKRRALADSGRALVERKYGWSRIIDSMDDLIHDAVSRHRRKSMVAPALLGRKNA